MRPNSVTQTTSVSSSRPRAFQVAQQRGGGLIEDRAVDVVLRLERLVAVPVADAFAHRVGAVEQLHEAHAAFEQPPGEQAVAGEAGLDRVRVVGAVQRRASRAVSLREVGRPRRAAAASWRPVRSWRCGPRVRYRRDAAPGVRRSSSLQEIARGASSASRRDARGRREVADRLVGVERRPLEHGRQERAAPVVRPDLRHAARIGDRHERRQVVGSRCPARSSPTAPMLGKPSSVKPVLIWFSAGPCVLLLAVIEWMKHMSSASSARFGSRSEIILPASTARFERPERAGQVAVLALERDEFRRPASAGRRASPVRACSPTCRHGSPRRSRRSAAPAWRGRRSVAAAPRSALPGESAAEWASSARREAAARKAGLTGRCRPTRSPRRAGTIGDQAETGRRLEEGVAHGFSTFIICWLCGLRSRWVQDPVEQMAHHAVPGPRPAVRYQLSRQIAKCQWPVPPPGESACMRLRKSKSQPGNKNGSALSIRCINSSCKLCFRVETRSTTANPMPSISKPAHLAAKARRAAARSLLLGLTSSIAAATLPPVSESITLTSIESGNLAGSESVAAGGDQVCVATPPAPFAVIASRSSSAATSTSIRSPKWTCAKAR